MKLDEETNRRMTFRTFGEVLDEAARLLSRSAQSIADASSQEGERQRLMMTTLADVRTRAAAKLAAFRADSSAEVGRTWLQYASSLDKAAVLHQELAAEHSGDRAILIMSQLDDCLVHALQGLSRSYTPPLESCEKASAVIVHLRRASSAIVNGARDI